MAVETPEIWLSNICRKNNLVLTEKQVHLLRRYVDCLLEWNKKINLISRRDEDRVWSNHVLHSISLLFKLNLRQDSRIMDLGTGGGLPGIPLKILLPDSQFLLLDSTRKKTTAVQDMVDQLGLAGIRTMWGRAEELTRDPDLVSHFDYIVARAVAPLKELVRWAAPLVRRSDLLDARRPAKLPLVSPPALLAFKGGNLNEELSKIRTEPRVLSIDEINLVFEGSEEVSSSDKKIVVVGF